MDENFSLGYIPLDENRGWLENADILGLCLVLTAMPESETKTKAKDALFQAVLESINKDK